MKTTFAGILFVLAAVGSPASPQNLSPSPTPGPAPAPASAPAPANVSDDLVAQLSQRIQANPNNIASYVQLGRIYLDRGDNDSAIATLTQAIKVDPYAYHALFNRARAYRRKGDLSDALADYNRTVQLDPHTAFGAYTNRGQIYLQQGNLAQAITDETQSIAINPRKALPYVLRAKSYLRQGGSGPAAADLTAALQLQPDNLAALSTQAWLLATCPDASLRNGPLAVQDATRACELTNWENPGFIDILAAACAEAGDFDNAVKWETQYLQRPIPTRDGPQAQARLALYRSHQAWHSTVTPPAPTGDDD
jgi:tetratricopeptide (TPR) repeat protein